MPVLEAHWISDKTLHDGLCRRLLTSAESCQDVRGGDLGTRQHFNRGSLAQAAFKLQDSELETQYVMGKLWKTASFHESGEREC
jgi:hypothetical protein